MTTEQLLLERIDALQHTVSTLVECIGPRLTRDQLCKRRGVHRNTLAKQIERGEVPRPGADGKWMLSEIVEWERMELLRKAA